MPTGILVHGRHVEAEGWEDLVWGKPPFKLGSVPTMILEALNALHQSKIVIVFGTGASEKNGLKEAEYTRKYLSDRIDHLKDFHAIRNHPELQRNGVTMSMDEIGLMFEWPGPAFEEAHTVKARCKIVCETKSQNTLQEIANAAAIFAAHDVSRVVQIACGSHLPRCITNQRQVREAGNIPASQRWYALADDMTFGNVPVQQSVAILERPHRGDDPMIKSSVQPHAVVPQLFGLPFEQRVLVLTELQARIASLKKPAV